MTTMEESESRARCMVDVLKECGEGCGLHVKTTGTVVILGPGDYPISENPTTYNKADIEKAVSLGLIARSVLKLMGKDRRVEIDCYQAL
jgi:hypothetical protein